VPHRHALTAQPGPPQPEADDERGRACGAPGGAAQGLSPAACVRPWLYTRQLAKKDVARIGKISISILLTSYTYKVETDTKLTVIPVAGIS
jgi:hypothetical protein